MRAIPLLATMLIVATPALGQTTNDQQVWVNATVMGRISGRLVYFAEVQPRSGDGVSRLDQLLLRPAIGWRISPQVTVYQGYAHVVSPVEGGKDRNEERSFQQIGWTLPPSRRGEIQSRTRLEQRWRSDGQDTGHRLREMIRGEYAFAESGKGVRALGSIEAFVALNDTDWGARGGFDQLRTFAGVEVPLKGRSTIEAGYLNQAINQTGGRTRMNHVLSVAVFLRH